MGKIPRPRTNTPISYNPDVQFAPTIRHIRPPDLIPYVNPDLQRHGASEVWSDFTRHCFFKAFAWQLLTKRPHLLHVEMSDRRKRSPQKKSNSSGNGNGNGGVSFSSSPPETKGNFMVGQVRILKRGEGLVGDTVKKIGEKVERVESESVFGKQPETTPKKFNIADFYAGSACDSSPPPSSLPVPGFFKKKTILVENNDYATCDLRRLLRLDLS
nr:uncharacterized SDCCAG3 family protein-like [Ipomoea batatas]